MDTSRRPAACTLPHEGLDTASSTGTPAIADLPAEIAGHVVLGCLGSGGMADVFAVRAPDGALRALKRLRAPRAALVARLRREAWVQGFVRHPNVLGLVGTVLHAGVPALVLPYVPGPTLACLLEDTRLAPADADALFAQIVAGVAALHTQGFVHRDLKPANILLDPTPDGLVARIADLGLVKVRGADLDETLKGTVLGTPAYAAPEQLQDAATVDPRADVWALGALWFELRTGARYERGARAGAPVGSGDPDRATDAAASLPWSEALLGRLLADDPAERPTDAAEVLGALPATGRPSDAVHARCRALAPAWGPEPGPALAVDAGETFDLARSVAA